MRDAADLLKIGVVMIGMFVDRSDACLRRLCDRGRLCLFR